MPQAVRPVLVQQSDDTHLESQCFGRIVEARECSLAKDNRGRVSHLSSRLPGQRASPRRSPYRAGRNVSRAFAPSKKVIGAPAAEITAVLGIALAFLVPIAIYAIFGESLEMAMDAVREQFQPWGWVEPQLMD